MNTKLTAFKKLQTQNKQLQANKVALIKALKKYGHHLQFCKTLLVNRNLKCTCGFEQILTGK